MQKRCAELTIRADSLHRAPAPYQIDYHLTLSILCQVLLRYRIIFSSLRLFQSSVLQCRLSMVAERVSDVSRNDLLSDPTGITSIEYI